MKKLIFAAMIALAGCCDLDAQTVSGPSTVQNGEAIHFEFDGFETGDSITWTLLNPYPEPELKTITSAFGTSYVVDPAVGWAGIVRVQCFVTDSEQRVKHFATTQTMVEAGKGPQPPPDPKPDDPPDPVSEYTGPNELGLGQLSFDHPPGDIPAVRETMVMAMRYLKGTGGINGNEMKPMAVETTDPAYGTEHVLPVWIAGQISDAGNEDWTANAYRQVYALNRAGTVVTKDQWYAAFAELVAGMEARQ